jgi:protein required for attachment to host cells
MLDRTAAQFAFQLPSVEEHPFQPGACNMAIDPVERVRDQTHQVPLALDLPAIIPRLAALRPSTVAPYLTVCLDWRPLGDEPGSIPSPEPKRSQRRALRNRLKPVARRPARLIIEQQFEEILRRYEAHTPALESLSADIDRINAYLTNDLDPTAHGVVIVANRDREAFAAIPLDVPVKTGATVGTIPSLRELVHAAEDFPPYAVVVAEQHEAILLLVERLTWERAVEFESNDYPRHQQQGGWSQRRYQDRADERVEHFANRIAEEIRRAFEQSNEAIEYLVIAADEPMYSALMSELHGSVKDRVIGRIHVELESSLPDVIDEAEPIVLMAERKRELAAVQAAHDGRAAGGKGVEGAQETVTALQAGQVQTLVMNDDFSDAGWADYTMPLYGAGRVPREHPAGGDVNNLVEVALEDALVRLAVLSDAEVELVWSAVPITEEELEDIPDAGEQKPRAPAAVALDRMGGVGAVLRFALDAGVPTAALWNDEERQETASQPT